MRNVRDLTDEEQAELQKKAWNIFWISTVGSFSFGVIVGMLLKSWTGS